MAIGERIRFLRNLRGLTQRALGVQIGYPEKTADVRIAQYESGTRGPKADTIQAIADVLGVSPQALTVPDIDSDIGLMHTLFTLEDLYGVQIDQMEDGTFCLKLDRDINRKNGMDQMLSAWHEQAAKLKSGELTKEAYDQWRYTYPQFDEDNRWAKIPSEKLSDAMLQLFQEQLKED